MKKLLLVSLCFLLFSVVQVFAQNRTITGTVTSKEDGLPVPGVTVRVKGAAGVTLTNANGKYSISAPTGSTLSFTFVSYIQQDVVVGNNDVVNISLTSDIKSL